MSLITREEVARVLNVARQHLKDDGLLLVVPDCFTETFRPGTKNGGGDDATRSIRYLEWTYDEDPRDELVVTEYAYLLRTRGGSTRVEHDRSPQGLFPLRIWRELFLQAGFQATVEHLPHSELPPESYYGIVGLPNG
jgi:hypothetical protein